LLSWAHGDGGTGRGFADETGNREDSSPNPSLLILLEQPVVVGEQAVAHVRWLLDIVACTTTFPKPRDTALPASDRGPCQR
jgi:hypothetical protein